VDEKQRDRHRDSHQDDATKRTELFDSTKASSIDDMSSVDMSQ